MARLAVLGALLALGACERAEPADSDVVRRAVASNDVAGESPPTPAGGYAIGRAPTPAELTAWSTAVGPDGATLPPGRGTVVEGAALYRAQCAACHGQRGEGIAPVYPALIGRDSATDAFRFAEDPALIKTVGNYWPYATTLFDYIKRAMPLLAPGSLTDDQVYALTAYLLAANQIVPDTATLDAAAVRAVRMPARDRFIPDDRPLGPTVQRR